MVKEQIEKIFKQCEKDNSEFYHGEYFLSKIRTLFQANHIKKFVFNVTKKRIPIGKEPRFIIFAEIIFDKERVYFEWEVLDD